MDDRFLGYKRINGNTVAEFENRKLGPSEGPTFVLDKSSCEVRLRNLESGGFDCGETQLALDEWPEWRDGRWASRTSV